jgi:hypothetical protein
LVVIGPPVSIDQRWALGVRGRCPDAGHVEVTRDPLGDGITVDLARAVPFGLLLNELVSNACKHAFPPGAGGAKRYAEM